MRATGRIVLFLLVGVLAGAGCESQKSLNISQAFPALTQPTTPAEPLSLRLGEVVTICAPRPLDELGEDGEGSVIWRASSRSVDSDLGDDSPGTLLQVARHLRDHSHHEAIPAPPPDEMPKELNKVTMPPYRIEPPDVLLINALRVVPKPPYKIEPLDELRVQAPPAQVLPNEPIGGRYAVGPDGRVDLGYSYGKVSVAGLTPEQAQKAIAKHVADVHGIKAPAVVVTLSQTRGVQQVRGEHPVRPDGMVSLGVYGDAYVTGLTPAEAKLAIEEQLSKALLNPEVTVEVQASNSKVFYVIYDDGKYGQRVFKLPIVGGETVLDAIAELRGLPASCSTHRIWIARPVPAPMGFRQILPVDWAAITEGGSANTNYQLMPGDRIYVKADRWIALNRFMSKVLAPFE